MRLTFAAIAISLTGCALVSGLSTLDVGASVVPATDGGPADGAGVDTGASDARVASDATDERSDAALVGCARYPSTVELCDDFEAQLGQKWDKVTVASLGTLSLATDFSVSPTHGLKATMSTLPVSATANYAALEKVFQGKWQDVVVDADLRVATPNLTANGTGLFVILLLSNKGTAGTVVFTGPDYAGQSIMSNEGASAYVDGPKLPYDAWTHVTIAVRPSTSTIALTIAGAKKEMQGNFPQGVDPTTSKISIQLGIEAFSGPTGAFDIRYDDVAVDLQ